MTNEDYVEGLVSALVVRADSEVQATVLGSAELQAALAGMRDEAVAGLDALQRGEGSAEMLALALRAKKTEVLRAAPTHHGRIEAMLASFMGDVMSRAGGLVNGRSS